MSPYHGGIYIPVHKRTWSRTRQGLQKQIRHWGDRGFVPMGSVKLKLLRDGTPIICQTIFKTVER